MLHIQKNIPPKIKKKKKKKDGPHPEKSSTRNK